MRCKNDGFILFYYFSKMAQYSVLSDKKIQEYLSDNKIVIYPFEERNLNTSSYDVTLGEWYFREHFPESYEDVSHKIYNMYSESDVKKIYKEPILAKPYSYYKERGIILENIKDDEQIIFIDPGETILCHTNEFIGGVDSVTTMMKARSSLRRNFIDTCHSAGWGDIGYYNRWTMEISNNSNKYKIPLIVGRRIAQIVFFETDGILDINKKYNDNGKYQNTSDIRKLKDEWHPYDMLPKMYKDWENK